MGAERVIEWYKIWQTNRKDILHVYMDLFFFFFFFFFSTSRMVIHIALVFELLSLGIFSYEIVYAR